MTVIEVPYLFYRATDKAKQIGACLQHVSLSGPFVCQNDCVSAIAEDLLWGGFQSEKFAFTPGLREIPSLPLINKLKEGPAESIKAWGSFPFK